MAPIARIASPYSLGRKRAGPFGLVGDQANDNMQISRDPVGKFRW